MRRQAEHDPLTGLPNRLLFARRLAGAAGAASTAVLFVDLDRFKSVNDEHGHVAGDELLTIVGARLRTCARNEDTVARLGGDEFAVLLLDSDPEIAAGVADRITTEIARPATVAGRRVSIGASVGIAMGWAGATADDLLSEADHRMYAHKRRAATS